MQNRKEKRNRGGSPQQPHLFTPVCVVDGFLWPPSSSSWPRYCCCRRRRRRRRCCHHRRRHCRGRATVAATAAAVVVAAAVVTVDHARASRRCRPCLCPSSSSTVSVPVVVVNCFCARRR